MEPAPTRMKIAPRRASRALPPQRFGRLAGTFDHATLVPEGGRRPDDNHIYLWLRVASGPFAGVYECAFNIHSERAAGTAAEVLFTERQQPLAGAAPPSQGFTTAPLSFADLGLQDGDFAPVVQGTLQSLVTHLAQTCSLVAAYGITYVEGTGLHDVHMNSGTGGPGDRRDQDGALAFYFAGAAAPYVHWVFAKFSNQHIPADH